MKTRTMNIESAARLAIQGPVRYYYTSASEARRNVSKEDSGMQGTDGGGADGSIQAGASGIGSQVIAYLPHHRDPKQDEERGATAAMLVHCYNHLPKLVEACLGLFDKDHHCEDHEECSLTYAHKHNHKFTCVKRRAFFAALTSADTVNLPARPL